jgi:hypothetical protein
LPRAERANARTKEQELDNPGNLVRRAAVLVVALAAIVYAGDYAVVRLRVASPRMGNAFDSVQVVRLLAIPLKNGRVDYELDATQPEATVTCVRALFPHLGYQPCWYVRRQSQKPIPMVILVSARP